MASLSGHPSRLAKQQVMSRKNSLADKQARRTLRELRHSRNEGRTVGVLGYCRFCYKKSFMGPDRHCAKCVLAVASFFGWTVTRCNECRRERLTASHGYCKECIGTVLAYLYGYEMVYV